MILLSNKKARAEFEIVKTLTAGMVLSGAEVKSLRLKNGSLTGSFVKIVAGEVFLLNAHIGPYSFADSSKYDPKQTRKLLLQKQEIDQLVGSLEKKNLTVIPLAIEAVGRRIKATIALARGLKKFEKRDKLKQRDIQRNAAREATSY